MRGALMVTDLGGSGFAPLLIAGGLVVAAVALWLKRHVETKIVYDFEKGLLYRDGSFVRMLDAGRYRILKDRSRIDTVDTRKLPFTLSGQEVLTKDNIQVRITTVGQYQVTDVAKAAHEVASYHAEFHTLAQLVLREQVGNLTLEELLDKKTELNAKLLASVEEGAKLLGLTVSAFAVRDVMLPANLKKAFVGTLEAQKEAQRQLEVARGEQAVLRSLANSSKLYENNPSLLQARVIQALSNGNNSIIFGSDDRMTVNAKRTK
jgi:regulator of protease activity HflC (stomatin/prohibitin superfamily)